MKFHIGFINSIFIFLTILVLPCSRTQSYTPKVEYLMFGDLTSFDDLYLPENLTEKEMQNVSYMRELLSDTLDNNLIYSIKNNYLRELENVTSDGEDTRDYNDASAKLYEFTRKAYANKEYYGAAGHWSVEWFAGHIASLMYRHWWYDTYLYYDHKYNKEMLYAISLTFLHHVRYKIALAFNDRESIRHDKRYRLGYLFNRLRRLKTEMLKVVAIAKRQYSFVADRLGTRFRNVTSLLRLYERVVRFDVDIRDTVEVIKLVFSVDASYDIYNDTMTADGLHFNKRPKMGNDSSSEEFIPNEEDEFLKDLETLMKQNAG